MAKNETKHVNPKVLAADRRSLAAVLGMPAYAARNPECARERLVALQAELRAKEEGFVVADVAWETARDALVAAKWAFHNAICAARGHVAAQFGSDSSEVQAVGWTRKSEHARPGPKRGSKRKPAAG